MNKKFHITITDNEKGTVELDVDTDCIVGAVHAAQYGQDGVVCLGYSDCSGLTVASTAFGAIKVSKQITNKPLSNALLAAMLIAETNKKEDDKDALDAEREDKGVDIPFPSPRKNEQS